MVETVKVRLVAMMERRLEQMAVIQLIRSDRVLKCSVIPIANKNEMKQFTERSEDTNNRTVLSMLVAAARDSRRVDVGICGGATNIDGEDRFVWLVSGLLSTQIVCCDALRASQVLITITRSYWSELIFALSMSVT